MKRAKRLYALLGVLAVVSVLAFAVVQYQERQEEIRNTDAVILSIDPETVTALAWAYDDEALSFHKNETWQYDGDAEFPVDAEHINELLSYFADMGAAFVIENVEDDGQYGLANPTCTITVTVGDEETEILLGDYSEMDEQRYVSIGDGNVYLLSEDPLSAFQIEISDLLDDDEIPTFGDHVDSISFSGAAEYDVVYQAYDEGSSATLCSDDVYYRKEGEDLQPLDTDNVDRYLDTISGIVQDTYVTYKATDEDLATYGLDDPELSVAISYTTTDEDGEETSEEFVLHLSRDAEMKAAGEEDADDEEKIMGYVRIGDSSIIYEISETSYDALMAASYDDLRHQDLFSGNFADVTAIDVRLDGEDYQLTSEEEDGSRTFSYGEEALDMSAIQEALAAITAESFTDEAPDDDAQEELSLTLHLANEVIPTLTLTFYRYDGDTCLAAALGESTALVPRSSVVDLVEAFHEIVL